MIPKESEEDLIASVLGAVFTLGAAYGAVIEPRLKKLSQARPVLGCCLARATGLAMGLGCYGVARLLLWVKNYE